MTHWHPVSNLDQLQPGEVVGVEVAGLDILLARESDGSVHALQDLCTHQDVALSDGDLEDGAVECWKHGSQFDLKTGQPRQLPATQAVQVYPVSIDQNSGTISVAL